MMTSSQKNYSLHRALEDGQKRKGEITLVARLPLGLFAIGGMLAIGFIKALVSGTTLAAALAAVLAAGLIVGYFCLVHFVRRLSLREDQLGDNCYYLGFLYTLASLAMALYQFATASSAEDPTAVTQIVGNFGIALFSTIVGILMRIMINQGQQDIETIQRDARMALVEAMVNLRVQLNDATLNFRSFCEQNEQITQDAIRNHTKVAHEAIDASVARIGETSNTVLNRIDEAFGAFNENTTKLNLVAAGTVQALQALIGRLESMEPPSDLISKRLDLVMDSTERAGNMLRQRLEADEKAIAGAAGRIREIDEKLRAAAENAGSAGTGLGGVSAAALRAVEAAEKASERLTALTGTMGKSFEAQERMLGEMRLGSERISTGMMEEQKRLASAARGSLEDLFGALKGHNDAMAGELERTRRMSADTGTALANMADVLTRRVEGMQQQLLGERAAG